MEFNYAKEKRRFDVEWLKLSEQYRKAGFNEVGIKLMREFDWELFCKRRIYENREQALPSEIIDANNHSILFKKFPSLTVGFDENSFSGRYDWIETIDSPILANKLDELSDNDKEFFKYKVQFSL